MLTKRQEKALDGRIEAEWYRQASGVQVSIMDIARIFRDVKAAVAADPSDPAALAEAVTKAIAKYRQN